MSDALRVAGERAAAAAELLWSLDVYDPPQGDTRTRTPEVLAVINEIIRTNGWGANTVYRGNGPPQWCGMFAGECWERAGLDPSWLVDYWASTYRLLDWVRYKKFTAKSKPNSPPADARDRRLYCRLSPDRAPAFTPQAGDIVIVGDGNPDAGDHITVCMYYDAKRRAFDTIAGNGRGVGPRGNRREGISREEYFIDRGDYRAMWLLRPAFPDLLAEAA